MVARILEQNYLNSNKPPQQNFDRTEYSPDLDDYLTQQWALVQNTKDSKVKTKLHTYTDMCQFKYYMRI
jgi:hypothetical protein